MALLVWRIISIAFLLCVSPISSQAFVFNGFNQANSSIITTSGAASIIKSTRLLRLTNKSSLVIGHSFYRTPFRLLNKSSSSVSSFSTHFVFSIVSPRSGDGGFGLAFVVAPTTDFPDAEAEHFLGLFNGANDGQKTNHIFAVEFDTVNGLHQKLDSSGNHVGININGMDSNTSKPAGYDLQGSGVNIQDLSLESEPIQAWVDYDSVEEIINVTVAPLRVLRKPALSLLYYKYNLSRVFKDKMYVGFSSSTGKDKASSHYILGWSFSIGGEPDPGLNLSLLPSPPPQEREASSSLRSKTKILVACLSAIIVALFLVLFFTVLYNRLASYERLEEWERDCPHRFGYRDLFLATKGFKDSEIIGVGGFGAVYKGVLPSTGCIVAVKKITRSSDLGMREFAAEIESLGRLRHKNLVNLQGWCKNKSNLLIVYDYIPFGSLDTLIFKPKSGLVLGWEFRVNILRGVASGLLYLHEEWEQVVIHRDVKSNNVLIDDHMCARLGDFGLARLHDHGEIASRTTGVVGTIGYIAPELARFGKASTATDVFAFGALLLEVATGRRPIGGDDFVLADWVMELHQAERVLEAADPALGGSYSRDDMELVLVLGLLCSHFKPEARPTMRQVIRYLDREDQIPAEIDQWGLFDSRRVSHLGARVMEGISSDKITSYRSSSVGPLSYSSLDAGR